MDSDNKKLNKRTCIEHSVIPDLLFTNHEFLIGGLLKDKEEFLAKLYNIIDDTIFVDDGIVYYPSDFKCWAFPTVNKGEISILIRTPDPIEPPQCSYILIKINTKTEEKDYYTAELNIDGYFFLCRAAENGMHMLLADACGSTRPENVVAILSKASVEPEIVQRFREISNN